MGICTNRLLMGQPLIALFISAKRHGSSLLRHVLRPTIIAKKENRSSFDRCWHKPAVERQAEHVRSAPGISDINLFRYSRALPQRRRKIAGTRWLDEAEFARLYRWLECPDAPVHPPYTRAV